MSRARLCPLFLSLTVLASPLSAGDTSVAVDDAEVVANQPGTFELPFAVTRTGNTIDGVRLLVETEPGGENPGLPGDDYVPLPPGTEALVLPGETGATVTVDVFGDPVPGPDKTLLLRVTAAQAFNSRPRHTSTALHIPVLASSPNSMAVVDLNDDGHLDIVTGNDLSFDVSVVLGQGDGEYASAVTYPVVGNVQLGRIRVAVGDVTGNGHPDIVAAGFNHTVEIFAGDGSGTFAVATPVSLGGVTNVTALALADLDGNGHLDIVTSNQGNDNVAVLLNDGSGGFDPAVSFATGPGPLALAIAALNENGALDIVTANGDGTASVLVGDGDGGFAVPQHYSLGPDASPRSVVVADATGNGSLDIVTASAVSLAASPSVSILEGDGAGGFAPAEQLPLDDDDGVVRQLAVGDITGSGRAEILVSRYSSFPPRNHVTVLVGDGVGGFPETLSLPTGDAPGAIVITDINDDGNADVVTANAVGGNVSILPGDGAGKIGFDGLFDVGELPYSVIAVDLNDDGHPDLVNANAAGDDVSVLLNDGAGGVSDAASFAVGAFPTSVAAGDVNDDGIPDLIVANFGGGSVSVLLGDGSGGFADAVSFSVGEGFQSPYRVAVGDVNDNGNLDIVTGNTNISNESVSLLLGDGTGGFADAVLFEIGPGFNDPRWVTLGDATGNGNLDIVTANSGSGNLSLFVGDGTGAFADPVHLATGQGPVVVRVADVTGDGHADLVALNHTVHTVSVLAGDGGGGFADAVHFPIFPAVDACLQNGVCPWAWGMVVADVNGDGHLDIVTANTDNNTVSVLPNDGSGGFPSFEIFHTGAGVRSVDVADVTGDGNPDVVSANPGNNNLSVLASELSGVVLLNDVAVGTIITDATELRFDPSTLDFGAVEVGTTSPESFALLRNDSGEAATGLAFSMPGAGFDAETSDCGDALPAGASCSISLTFTPTAPGPAAASLQVSSEEGGSAGLGLAGSGVGAGEGFSAVALLVDPETLLSDGNEVFEPGESAVVAPSWRNDDTESKSLSGTVSDFTGPEGAEYAIVLGSAEYGLLEPGAIASCLDSGVCYQLSVDDLGARPSTRWVATFEETLSDGTAKTWNLHIGDSFADVPRESPFYRWVETLLHTEVTGGCSAAEYCPTADSSRGQMPVFVLRALEGADYEPQACVEGEEVFADVPATSAFCPWIQELFLRDVVAGCGEDLYCPDDPVNRQQMAIFLLRTLEGPDYTPEACVGIFDDVPCSSPFAVWVEELFHRDVTGGCGTDPLVYCPTDPVNRQQMAVFISRAFALELYGP